MVGPYRLSELGFQLPAGTHLLPAGAAAEIESATGVLEAAEARASVIVAAAEDAYRARSEDGFRDGQARARAEAAQALLAAQGAVDAGLRELEGEVTRLVADCVRKLMIDFDNDARALATVRMALRTMRREKRAELRVAPAQVAAVRAGLTGILAEFPEIELVDVVEDAALSPPRIVLESRVGRVEADLGWTAGELERMIRAALPVPDAPASEVAQAPAPAVEAA